MSSPHLAVNTRLLLPNSTEGIARFGVEVLRRMTQRHPEVRFSFLFDRPFNESFIFSDNVVPYVVPPQARHPILWYLWFHLTTRRKVTAIAPDAYFSPELYLCPGLTVPQIAVFHDVAYEHYPHILSPAHRWYIRHYSRKYQVEASHILTVSDFNRQDIHEVYGTPLEKISVAYNGVSDTFHPVPAEVQARIRARYTDGKPYFLFVGTIQPRKNVANLLRAFDRFKSSVSSPVKLLIVGKPGWNSRDLDRVHTQMQHRDEVLFAGKVPGEEINAVFSAALALTFVPVYEGFGMPIIEAMRTETPVLCANVSAMPEIYGDAAYGVDPHSVDQIAEGMRRLAQDISLRERLVQRGITRQAEFTWDKTYESVWKVISPYLYQ